MTGRSHRCGSQRPRRPNLLAAGAAVLGWCLLAGGSGGAFAATALPTTDEQLVSTVRQALQAHDLAALENLVNWDGATPMRRRLVVYQMRYGFGRPIRSITLEPFPEGGFSELQVRGTLMLNMPVTQRLRVVFDEPDNGSGHPPGVMFLIGQQQQAYRIALVVPVTAPGGGAGK